MTPRTRKPPTGRSEAENLEQVLEVLRLFSIDHDRQNTGGIYDATGRYIRYGRPGNSDVSGMLPAPQGRKLDIEVKAEGFDPRKLRGKKLEHWQRQKARLDLTNAQGGAGFWVDDAKILSEHILPRLLAGYRIESQDDEGRIVFVTPQAMEPRS